MRREHDPTNSVSLRAMEQPLLEEAVKEWNDQVKRWVGERCAAVKRRC